MQGALGLHYTANYNITRVATKTPEHQHNHLDTLGMPHAPRATLLMPLHRGSNCRTVCRFDVPPLHNFCSAIGLPDIPRLEPHRPPEVLTAAYCS
jgi:hypothetical protein